MAGDGRLDLETGRLVICVMEIRTAVGIEHKRRQLPSESVDDGFPVIRTRLDVNFGIRDFFIGNTSVKQRRNRHRIKDIETLTHELRHPLDPLERLVVRLEFRAVPADPVLQSAVTSHDLKESMLDYCDQGIVDKMLAITYTLMRHPEVKWRWNNMINHANEISPGIYIKLAISAAICA